MTGILAALNTSGGATKIVQTVPLVVVYLATIAAIGWGIFKLNGNVWHKLLPIFTFVLGAFITVAVPKVATHLTALSGTKDRLAVDTPMVLLLIVAVVMSFVENK